jgi:hypothetical protein
LGRSQDGLSPLSFEDGNQYGSPHCQPKNDIHDLLRFISTSAEFKERGRGRMAGQSINEALDATGDKRFLLLRRIVRNTLTDAHGLKVSSCKRAGPKPLPAAREGEHRCLNAF